MLSQLLASLAAAPLAPDSSWQNYYAPGVVHKNNCAQSGVWEGSCDILDDGTVLREAQGNIPGCDPWNGVMRKMYHANASTGRFETTEGKVVPMDYAPRRGWTCPVEHQSLSGCGDMRSDTRKVGEWQPGRTERKQHAADGT